MDETKNNLVFEILKEINDYKENLPFHINVIDELRANENAHSRILTKLFQYQENGQNILLQSFLSYLKYPFDKLFPVNPEISYEKNRIDVRIRWKDHSIIIENKIHNAPDTKNQIENYYKIEKSKYQKVFVIYLGRQGNEKPSENSLPKELENLMGANFKAVGFKDTILFWLQSIIQNETFSGYNNTLKSAIYQYLDHLEGMFYLRKNQKNMKETIEKIINDKLSIKEAFNPEDYLENFEVYEMYFHLISELLGNVSIMKERSRQAYFDSHWKLFKETITNKIPQFNVKTFNEDDNNKTYKAYGIELKYENNPFYCVAGFDFDKKTYSPYISIRKSPEIITDFIELLEKKFEYNFLGNDIQYNSSESNADNIDYCSFYISFEELNETYIQFAQKVIQYFHK